MSRVRLALAWAGQLVPPISMLVLVGLPFDTFSMLFWLVGALAALVSVATLVRLSLARWRGPEQARGHGPSPGIRPAITIAIFVIAVGVTAAMTARFRDEADALGRALARDVQAVCERDGRCPSTPVGWDSDCRAVGFMRVCYRPGEDDRTFAVVVRHRTDDLLVLTGGPGGLTEERRCC